MKTILITGGAGFIGSAVVREFLDEGAKVVVYDNFSYGRREFLPDHEELTIVDGDINDTEHLAQAISEYHLDYVCHLAAMHFIPHCNANPTKALYVNTVGTESVLTACCKGADIEKVLIASTAAVYDVNDEPNNESRTPVKPVDIYGLSKMFTELLAEKFARKTSITTVSIRFFNAVGPRETNPHVIPHIFESTKKSSHIPLGNIKPKRDYIHTSDMAGALLAVCRSDISQYQVFNVGSGVEYSVEEVVEMVGEILHEELTIRQEADRVREVERKHLVADIGKIKEVTGWEPNLILKEALVDTAQYYGFKYGEKQVQQ